MTTSMRKLATMLVCGTLFTTPILAGCDQQDGPAEQVGEKIDDTVK